MRTIRGLVGALGTSLAVNPAAFNSINGVDASSVKGSAVLHESFTEPDALTFR